MTRRRKTQPPPSPARSSRPLRRNKTELPSWAACTAAAGHGEKKKKNVVCNARLSSWFLHSEPSSDSSPSSVKHRTRSDGGVRPGATPADCHPKKKRRSRKTRRNGTVFLKACPSASVKRKSAGYVDLSPYEKKTHTHKLRFAEPSRSRSQPSSINKPCPLRTAAHATGPMWRHIRGLAGYKDPSPNPARSALHIEATHPQADCCKTFPASPRCWRRSRGGGTYIQIHPPIHPQTTNKKPPIPRDGAAPQRS